MKPKLNQLYNIDEKCVLVTGACGHFGSYIVPELWKLGAKVISVSHSPSVKKWEHSYCVDFYDREKTEKMLKVIRAEHTIDVIVNIAYDMSNKTGFNIEKGFLENLTFEEWSLAFQSGLYWPFMVTQIIGEQMKEKGGSIINVGSMYSIVSPSPELYEKEGFHNPITYTSMKSGLLGFSRYVAAFWGQFGIRCNTLLPGAFPNGIAKRSQTFIDRLVKKTSLKRVGELEDLMGALVFLASDASSFMTGQVLCIDGGWTVT